MKPTYLFILLPLLICLQSCSKPAPPKSQIEGVLKASLPPWLELSEAQIATEEVFENEFQSKVTAKIVVKDDTYSLDSSVDTLILRQIAKRFPAQDIGPPTLIELEQTRKLTEIWSETPPNSLILREISSLSFLSRVATKGEYVTAYATVTSVRTDSGFITSEPQWEETALFTMGKPRSAFPSENLIADPETIDAKVDEISAKLAELIASTALKEEARLEAIRSAFAEGRQYTGIWTDPGNGTTGKVDLLITESDGRTFRGVLFDPEKPKETRPATGVVMTDNAKQHGTLVGVLGEGQPPRDLRPDGMHALAAWRFTASQTYYRFLEAASHVDFRLRIDLDGRILAEGMLTASSGRGGRDRGKIEFWPKNQEQTP